MNFCDKCYKIVPDEEITPYSEFEFRGEIIPARKVHQYYSYTNIAPPSDGMNCCMGYKMIYCGNIREPTDFEYFFYITCDSKI